MRFYDADSGTITVDGVDVKLLDPSWLRNQARLIGCLIGFVESITP
jgi:ABC-type multidrug transport system fused ATPase/permease subunit